MFAHLTRYSRKASLFTIRATEPRRLPQIYEWNRNYRLLRESVMYQVLNCLVTEHDWRLVVLAGAICWFASAVAISLFHRARASQRPNARDLDLPRRGCRRLRNLGYPFRRDAGLRSRRRRRIQHTHHAVVAGLRDSHCRHRPLHCAVQCAPIGGCDRRRRHRRRRRGDALYRHGGTRASGASSCGRPVSFWPRSFSAACSRRLRCSSPCAATIPFIPWPPPAC